MPGDDFLRDVVQVEKVTRDLPVRPSTMVLEDPILVPESAAFHGLPGEVARTLAGHSEADPAALVVGFLAEFGAMVGPVAEARVGFAHHPPALFFAFVGRTSRSRKGTATTDKALERLRARDETARAARARWEEVASW
jgi:hypothetical protein